MSIYSDAAYAFADTSTFGCLTWDGAIKPAMAAAFDAGASHERLSHVCPVPVVASPETLTDPDDPRIRPGAVVEVVHTYTLTKGIGYEPGQWSVDGIQDRMRSSRGEVRLVAEAEAEAADPDADTLSALGAVLEYTGDPLAVLTDLREAGFDVTKRAVA